jgi:hypothetical protein
VSSLNIDEFKVRHQGHSSTEEFNRLLKIFHRIKHEFSNGLQIIYSMIQLEKYDRALNCINDMKKESEHLNSICRLTDPGAVCFLLELILSLRELGIDVNVEISEDYDYETVKQYYFNQKVEYYVSKINNAQSLCVSIYLSNSVIVLYSKDYKEEIARNDSN